MSGHEPAWKTSAGYDNTSRVTGEMPSAAKIIGWAKELLEIPAHEERGR
jgi:hypothetical protein